MSAVSLNVAKKLGDYLAGEAILDTVGEIAPDWAVVFLVECDGHLRADHPLLFQGHLFERFYAGAGSLPFSVIVRNSRVHCLRSVVAQGRAC